MKTANVNVKAMDAVAVIEIWKMKQEQLSKKEINEDTMVADILEINPSAADLLSYIGFHCMGCQMSMVETLGEGCRAHGMSDKEIKELIKRLNKK